MAEPEKKKKRLGEILREAGLISEDQLREALETQQRTGERIGKILVKLGMIEEDKMMDHLGDQLGIPHINLSTYSIDPEVVKLIPEKMARKYQAFPLFKIGDSLTVSMSDPFDVVALDNLKYISKCKIEPAISSEVKIQRAIDQYYRSLAIMKEIAEGEESIEVITSDKKDMDLGDTAALMDEAPVIKLINSVIMQAIQSRASDIHIEPEKNILRIRFRIDGVLHEIMSPPKRLHAAMVSRVKVMADMDIAEKRMPQDGRFHVKFWEKEISFRVSTMAIIHGEKVVLRILDKSAFSFGLEQLGLGQAILEEFEKLVRKPYGIVLVTGPTGSGKTTTLYAALDKINTLDKNIITIEDPVEYELKSINQVPVNAKVGLTFAEVLRTVLRQDPNVIMVGEIRDVETAEIAVRAALTGHLVFSTLHTNDAPGAVTRLIDMGIEPFLISSGILGVLAQRLVRRLCDKCKEEYVPTKETVETLGLDVEKEYKLYKPKGCKHCQGTGYRGRQGIYELFVPDHYVRDLIIRRPSTDMLRQAGIHAGMKSLMEDGFLKVQDGLTSIEEVMRVTEEV
ncbi:MAG: type II secretion system ATPase GspE [bacterium]